MTPEEKIAEFASAFTDLTNSFNATADSAAQALAKRRRNNDEEEGAREVSCKG